MARLRDDGERQELRRRALQRALFIALAILVGLGLVWYGCVRAWGWMTSLEQFRVYPGNLALQPVPWLNLDALRADMRRTDPTGLLSQSCSFFLPRLAGRVATAYGASPWVRRVVAVRRRFPRSLEITLEVRKPYATVAYRGGSVVVDDEGVVLDPQLYRLSNPPVAGRPDIVMCYDPESAPRRGERWNCQGVSAGIDMLAFLGEGGALNGLRVRAVEVRKETAPSGNAQLCVVLKTDSGAEIKWGLPPKSGGATTAEVSTSAKVEALQGIVAQHRARLSQVEYIDVRWDRPTLRMKAF